jgi:hypothetical protein
MPILVAESVLQNFDQNRSALPLPPEQRTDHGETGITSCSIPISWNGRDGLTADAKETAWRDDPQVGVVGDLLGPEPGTFGETSFGECLQAPGNLSEQMLAMSRLRLLLKQFAIPLTQPG